MKSSNSIINDDKKDLFSAMDESLKKVIQKHIIDFIYNNVSIDLTHYDNGSEYTIQANLILNDENGQQIDTMIKGRTLTIEKPNTDLIR